MVKTPQRQLGARLRQKRMAHSLSQAQMATALDISPSYLNLIEHGRRNASTQLIARAAQILETPRSELEHGVAPHVIEDVLQSAQEAGFALSDPAALQEAAMQAVALAQLISQQRTYIRKLEGRLKSMDDRISHDDVLSAALHEVLSTVTSIRSMASILSSGEDVSSQWLNRFHRNIDEDGRRLADAAQSLAQYLSRTDPNSVSHIEYTLDQFWQERGYYIPEIEHHDFNVDAFIKEQENNLAKDYLLQLHKIITIMHQDACDMPRNQIAPLSCNSDEEILALANRFRQPVASVLRRISFLPQMPPSGLVIMDNSGSILFSKPYLNFDPRLCWDGICPLWPVFQALQGAGGLVSRAVTLEHGPLSQFWSQSAKDESAIYANLPHAYGVMRMISQPQATQSLAAQNSASPLALGLRCRICPQANCKARRSAAIY